MMAASAASCVYAVPPPPNVDANRQDIAVKMDGRYTPGKAPAVRLINATKALTIVAAPTARAGIYRARLMFPTAGIWRVLVVDRETGRSYEFRRVRVRAT